jgi:acetyl esterase/lipase
MEVIMRYAHSIAAMMLILLAGASARGEDWVKVTNIPYLGEAADTDYAKQQCRLDVYHPVDAKGYATIVWFHGGGLTGGTRQSGIGIVKRFVKEGYGVVLVSYRFSPRVKCPTYIEDAAASVAWTIKHIAEYGGDPKKVFVSGHSAGGYLTSIVGADNRYLAAHGLSTDDLAGCMPIAGHTITHFTIRAERGIPGTRPIIDEYAPAYHVRKDAPPFLCIAADHDMAARAEENLYFTAVMQAAGNKRIECLIVPDRTHSTIVGKFSEADDEVAAAMLKFMRGITK